MFSFGLGTAQAKDRISYFHSDISGSPIAATNDSGDLLWEETYKPYGERLNDSDSTNKGNNNSWFTGKQEEADLGLQYFGARWYHQASGRFISRDPAAVVDHVESNPMMFNRYAYANNNPYKYVDPDGRIVWFIPLVIFIAKEVASEGIEQVTGVSMPTVKNGLKYAIKQANKQIAKEGMKQAAKIVKATSKKRSADGRLRHANGKYAYDGGSKKSSGGSHGNNSDSDAPATLYGKFDRNGKFEKWGISQDTSTRYSKADLAGGRLKRYRTGKRSDILKRERRLVERFPGPKNKESWAGVKRPK